MIKKEHLIDQIKANLEDAIDLLEQFSNSTKSEPKGCGKVNHANIKCGEWKNPNGTLRLCPECENQSKCEWDIECGKDGFLCSEHKKKYQDQSKGVIK